MPAESEAQRQFFSLVRAVQKGERDPKTVTSNVRDAARDTSAQDVEDMMKTKKNAPEKVEKENIQLSELSPKTYRSAIQKRHDPYHPEENVNNEAFMPVPEAPKQVPEGMNFFEIVGRYNEYGSHLRRERTLGELGQQLADIAEYAEHALTNEMTDWFDAHTVKRNVKEMKGYAKEFQKIAMEADSYQQRMTALYDDMGRVLERYFDIYDAEEKSQHPAGTDIEYQNPPETGSGEHMPDEKYWKDEMVGDQEPEMYGSPTDPKKQLKQNPEFTKPEDERQVEAHDEGDTEEDRQEMERRKREARRAVAKRIPGRHEPVAQGTNPYANDRRTEAMIKFSHLTERAINIARSKMNEADAVKFNGLPKQMQARVAWRALI